MISMMKANKSAIDAFWQEYIATDPQRLKHKPQADAFAFGNTDELADEIARLVLEGKKTATSMLMWELEAENRTLWNVGDEAIVLDSMGNPVCVIRTSELVVKPFNAVDEQFVYDYGEGDRSLAWWNTVMKDYYYALASKLGRRPAEGMPLIGERFCVVFPHAHDNR